MLWLPLKTTGEHEAGNPRAARTLPVRFAGPVLVLCELFGGQPA